MLPTMTSTSTLAYDKASAAMSAGAGLSAADQKSLKKSCDGFEGIFLTMMMREMEKTVHTENMFSGGKAEEMFKDLKIMALSDKIAAGDSFGLSESMYKQLSREAEKKESV